MGVFDLEAILRLNSSQYDKGLDEAKGKASGFGSALGTAVKVGAAAIGAATTAVAGFATASVNAGMGFDATMSEVAAISGAVGDDFTALRNKAQEMGATTKFSASEAADALTYMAMAGWKTEDMLGGIEGIMSLAAASGEDLATTSDIVTDALTAFGMTADESGHFADILAAASSNANTNVSLMGETFKYVAPAAGALGYTAEDMATAIGLMANAGIKGSQAGTALRSVLTRMAKPTKESDEAMQALGLSLVDAEGNMKSFGDIMLDMRDGFKNKLVIPAEEVESMLLDLNDALEAGELSQKDYDNALDMLMNRAYGAEGALMAQYAAMLGGQEAMSGLLAIVNASDEDFEKLTAAIYEADGASEQMAATMQDNLLGDITIFKSALEAAKIAVSDKLTPSLREFVQFGTDGLSTLVTAFKEDGVNGAIKALGTILTDGMALITTHLPDAIDAGLGLLQALMQGISDNIDLLSDTAIEVIFKLAEFLLSNLPDIVETGLDVVISLANGIAENLDELVPTIVDVVLQIVDTLTDPETLSNLIDAAIAIIVALAEGLIDSLPDLAERVPEIIENIVETLIENLPKLLKASVRIIGKLAQGLIENLPLLFQAAGKIVAEIVGGIGEVIHDLWDAGKEAIENVFDGFSSLDPFEWGSDLISNFVDGIKQKWDNLKEGVRGIAQTVKDLIGFSEPKEGPLSDFHTYAPDMMKLFAEGIRNNEHLIRDQIESSFDFGDMTIGTADIDTVSEQKRAAVARPMYNTDDLATAIRGALAGAGVYMDGRLVGQLVTDYQASRARVMGV